MAALGKNKRKHVTNGVAKRKPADLPLKLTEGEQDLVSHLEGGYQLETDSLGGNPVLRRLKDDEVIRPASANASSVKARKSGGSFNRPTVAIRSQWSGV